MKNPKTIVVLVIILLVIIVLFQNSEAVPVKFLWKKFEASAFIIYLIFYVLGVASAVLGMFWRRI